MYKYVDFIPILASVVSHAVISVCAQNIILWSGPGLLLAAHYGASI